MALSPIIPGSFNPSYAREADTSSLTTGLLPPAQVDSPSTPFGFDEANKQVWVNGTVFHADDHQSALESKSALDQPVQPMPSNFRAVDINEFGGYIKRIKDPSFGRLAKKNFGIGVDISQMLGGSALKFFGAEETGQAIIDQQQEDIRYNQPYQRTATDTNWANPEQIGDWFVANAAQMAPLMAEMIVTSAFTGGLGGIAAGSTHAGAQLLARGAMRNLATNAASGLSKLRAGQPLSKLELSALRKAGATTGAKIGAVAAAEGVAIGDIYQTIEESGNYDSPTLARLVTALASPFYAASELLPAAVALKVAGQAIKAGGRGNRFLKGAGLGALLEGSTETTQDIISMGAAGTLDFSDPEVRNQLINAFAAGAGVGAPLGGLANAIPKSRPKIEINNINTPADVLAPLQIEYQVDARAVAQRMLSEYGNVPAERRLAAAKLRDLSTREPVSLLETRQQQTAQRQSELSLPDQRTLPFLRGGEGTAPVAAQGEMFAGADLGQAPASTLGDGQQMDLFGGTRGAAIRNLQAFDAQQAAAMQERIQPFENVQSNRIEGVQQPLERNMSLLENELAAPTPPAPTQMDLQQFGEQQAAQQQYINQPPPPNPVIGEQLQQMQAAQQAAQQAQQAQLDAAQEQQFQQAMPPLQPMLPLAGGEASMFQPGAREFTPQQIAALPATADLNQSFDSSGEPMIYLPRLARTVPARQAIEEARQRVEALENLRNCLRKG
jgi:hypothetical protein